MTIKPMVSIVIPAYNEERLIGECLKSLHKQNFFGNFEIIVVDNNSIDQTAAIAAALGARVIFEPKIGVCAARQAGTKAARGDIIVSTDADTVFPIDWLGKIYENFSNDEIVAVTGAFKFFRAPVWARLYNLILFQAVKIIYFLTGRILYAPASNTAFRKSAWPGYNTNLTQGGDELTLLVKLSRQGRLKFIDNEVLTSSRRVRQGFLYNFLITFLCYYLFDYGISFFAGKSLLGPYAPFRDDVKKPGREWLIAKWAISVFVIFFAFHSALAHAALTKNYIKRLDGRLDRIEDRISWRH